MGRSCQMQLVIVLGLRNETQEYSAHEAVRSGNLGLHLGAVAGRIIPPMLLELTGQ